MAQFVIVIYQIDANAVAAYCVFGAFGIAAGILTLMLPETVGLKPPDSFEDLLKLPGVKQYDPKLTVLPQKNAKRDSVEHVSFGVRPTSTMY